MEEFTNETLEATANEENTNAAAEETEEAEEVTITDGQAVAETIAEDQDAAEAPADGQSTAEAPAKRKIKLPAKIQKLVDYIKSHEDVRQMVFFLLFSVICGATQLIVTYALSAGLKLEAHLGSTRLDWFVFHFATQAEFVGFLVGSVVGQVLTFVLNRKKTFNVPDHVAIRAIMYAIMAVLIIIMQTALGGAVTDACWQAKPDANGFLDLVFNLTGQLVAGIAALIVNFLGNKFFIMRNWGKKKAKAQNGEAESVDTTETTEQVAPELAAQAAADSVEDTQN